MTYEYHNVVWQPKVTLDAGGLKRVEWVVVSDTVPMRRGAVDSVHPVYVLRARRD